jgi:hypothetical protein
MSNDTKGYYDALGVAPSATPGEIDIAFRHLEKELDPSFNTTPTVNFRRNAVREAYTVLSDPAQRARYDAAGLAAAPQALASASQAAAAASPAAFAGPVACSVCGTVPDEPRYAAYQYVVSVVVMSFRRAFKGVYCAACARKRALMASAISGIAGWWGIPWGPIWTVPAIVRNASGGIQPAQVRDDFAWRNTLVFIAQGDKTRAYRTARMLRGSKNANIAHAARELSDRLQIEGVDGASVSNRSEWANPDLHTAMHYAFLLLIPALFAVLVMIAIAAKQVH